MFEISRKQCFAGVSLILAAMLASGCANQIENWDEVNEVPELKVHAVDYTHDVHFDPVTNEPDNLELEQLAGFLKRINMRRDDPVEVQYENTPSQRKRAAIMKAVMVDQGYRVNTKRIDPVETADGQTLPIVISVTKAVIKLPDCPNWNDDPLNNYSNLASENYGCATVTNLGLMVERPMDLIRGRGERVFDGDMAATSIDRYRKRQTEELLTEDVSTTGSSGGG